MSLRTSLLALVAVVVVVLSRAGADPRPSSPPSPPVPAPAPTKPAAKDVEAGPLFDQAEAGEKCPQVCKPPTKWNGSWRTLKAGISSVCGCAEPAPLPPPPPAGPTRDVEAGPLMNQAQATAKCPSLCKAPATWNGVWRTTKPSVMSICTCQDPPPAPPVPVIKTVETSSIKSSAEAKTKCTKACAPPLQWSGEWKKQSKKKATCDCIEPPPPAAAPAK